MTFVDVYIGQRHLGLFVGTVRSAQRFRERLLADFPQGTPTLVYSQEAGYPPQECKRLRSVATPISTAFLT